MKMTIGVIIRSYGEKESSGMARLMDLVRLMVENGRENEYIIYFKEKPKNPPVFAGKNWRISILGFGALWLDLGLFFAPRSDVYLFFTPVMPFFFRPKKSIVMVHDFGYKYFKPSGFKMKIVYKVLHLVNKRAFKKSSAIAAVSRFTKEETVRLFGIAEKKIKVVYDGFTRVCSLEPEELKLAKPFFLFVGVVKERKNALSAVKAFKEFKKTDGRGFKFVIAGKKSGAYYGKILEFIKRENLTDDIVFLGYVNDNKLARLYQNAECLVFPSLVEGFGLSVLEAMDCGLPVITSNRGALAETAGDAAILVDPENPREIAEKMKEVVGNEQLRSDLIKKGIERAKQFSWRKNAQELIALANSLK